jgi:tetratricopeptide (TPR) repeat protein
MKNLFYCIALSFLSFLPLQGQENIDAVIRAGVYLHDKGDYKGAIEQYEKALSINPSSERTMYEMSMTYLEMSDFTNALKYSTKVINSNYKPLLLDAYNVKGSALAGLQKYADAIVLLKDALKKCGDDYLLHYNLGLSYFKNHDSENAIVYLEKSINEKVNYSESYFLYAYALSDQNRWIEALLAFDSFLLLDPDDERSKDVFADMMDILQNKLVASDEKPALVRNLDLNKVKNTLLTVKNAIPVDNKDNNNYLYFQEATKSILAELKLAQKEENQGMFWEYFVPTFIDILDSGYFDTFSRYISAAAYPESLAWWKANQKQVDEFTDWFESTNGGSDVQEDAE